MNYLLWIFLLWFYSTNVKNNYDVRELSKKPLLKFSFVLQQNYVFYVLQLPLFYLHKKTCLCQPIPAFLHPVVSTRNVESSMAGRRALVASTILDNRPTVDRSVWWVKLKILEQKHFFFFTIVSLSSPITNFRGDILISEKKKILTKYYVTQKKNTIEIIALFSIILRKYPARRTKLFIIQSKRE